MNTTTEPTAPPAHQLPRPGGPPRRWKLWLAMVCGIYPIILAVETAGEPLLRRLVPAAQLAIVVPIMVAVMVWGVLPQIHRRFGAWLAR